MTTITLRPATADDRTFIDGLSPRLSGVPRPAWHDLAAMEGFQDRHMAASFAPVDGAATLIACAEDGRRLGYIHLRPARDGVTDEPCGYVSPARHDAGGGRHGRCGSPDGRRRGLGARPRLSAAEPRRVRRQQARGRVLRAARLPLGDLPHGQAAIATRLRMLRIDIAREALVDARIDVRLHRADRVRRRSIATGSTDRAGCASRPASAP